MYDMKALYQAESVQDAVALRVAHPDAQIIAGGSDVLVQMREGKHIRTLEGLLGPNGELSDIQQAFVDEAAIQCGFCTPGFILTAVEILESGKEYTDDELRKLLSGHLCRCTGYENILRAVKKTMYKRLGKPMPEA